MSASITFYGGLDEIGGNKILLEDKGTRIFLDFGKSFAARSMFYEWTERPRQANGIGDFLTLGILPKIKGIYRSDLLHLANMPSVEDKFVDGVILSHAHSDHADYISFLREDLDVWMGETTSHVIRAIEQEKDSNIEYEITQFKNRPSVRNEIPIKRRIKTFRTGSHIVIDSIEIEPIHVDHSLPGCYGFIIYTSSGTLVYSGDLRMHGMRPDLTTDFVEKAAVVTPELMLCEGTRINDATSSNENIVYETCNKVATQANEINLFIFADYSYKDIDRFQTFYKLAKSSNRVMLITPKTARYLSLLAKNDPELSKVIPKANDEFIGVYKHRAKSGSYADKDYDTDDLESFRETNVWTYKEAQTNKSKIIMALGAYHVQELIDLNPGNGIYMHSSSEPFNEEGEVDETRTNNWIERFGMVQVHAHCSGHASSGDLNRILDSIRPKQITPMHTEHPEFFRTFRGDGALRLAEPMKPVLIK